MKKPLHKHIGHRVKKYHGHFTKYLYERDTIFATVWVFVFIIVLGLIPINFYFLNPMKLALKDFDFNDIAYAKLKKGADTKLDSNIVIINIDTANRKDLADVTVPTLVVHPTADTEIRLHQAEAIRDGSGAADVTYRTVDGAEHYLHGRRREAIDLIVHWLQARNL